eukprot:780686_1
MGQSLFKKRHILIYILLSLLPSVLLWIVLHHVTLNMRPGMLAMDPRAHECNNFNINHRDRDEVCYEWEFHHLHRTVFNTSYNKTIRRDLWCQIHSIEVTCNALLNRTGAQQYMFAANSYIVCDVQSFDDKGKLCMTGGGSFKLFMVLDQDTRNNIGTNAFYLEGDVIDLFNGSYMGIIYTGYSLGKLAQYHLIIRLDFIKFDGTFGCFINDQNNGLKARHPDVDKIELNVMYNRTIQITMPMNTRDAYDELGHLFTNTTLYVMPISYSSYQLSTHYHWIKNNQNEYEYLEFHNRTNVVHINDEWFHTLINQDSRQWFQSKWIHFMGRSRTENMFKRLCVIFQQNKDIIYENQGRNYGNIQRFCYIIDLKLMITFKGHSVHYDEKSTRFNATNYFMDLIYFIASSDDVLKYQKILSRIPDVMVLNKGIHDAHRMVDKQNLLNYKYEVNAYMKQIVSTICNTSNTSKKYIYWRRSRTTHWIYSPQLEMRGLTWSCRSTYRMNCLNRLADATIYQYIDQYAQHERIQIGVLDDYTLSLGRSDCTHDNRHYLSSNCLRTMVYNFLFQLWKDTHAFTRD